MKVLDSARETISTVRRRPLNDDQKRVLDNALKSMDENQLLDEQEQEVLYQAMKAENDRSDAWWTLVFSGVILVFVAFKLYCAAVNIWDPWHFSFHLRVVLQFPPSFVSISEFAAAVAALTAICALVVPSDSWWLWLAWGQSTLVALFWGVGLWSTPQADFPFHLLWLPLGPAAMCLLVMTVLSFRGSADLKLRELAALRYHYKKI
eukprot:gnl/Spiro4/1080_TR560_c0_g1_i1.p1 gnl/Spiro4/1080_TR560_c0_g1~~gnl/Spiro4/1080_TR560_c0_g1_i1.p1  ORF type:complete len:206 (+),score=53.39 gnl/Spiro4/1080_TR560_c0_g1_i1:199-816(+)